MLSPLFDLHAHLADSSMQSHVSCAGRCSLSLSCRTFGSRLIDEIVSCCTFVRHSYVVSIIATASRCSWVHHYGAACVTLMLLESLWFLRHRHGTVWLVLRSVVMLPVSYFATQPVDTTVMAALCLWVAYKVAVEETCERNLWPAPIFLFLLPVPPIAPRPPPLFSIKQ